MHWIPVIKQFKPNIQHIAGVDNILSNILSRLPYTSVENYKPSTSKAQCLKNDLFEVGIDKNNGDISRKIY